jgi:predicted NBD/HSP70 family sugar kinase
VVDFVREALPSIASRLPPYVSARIGGMGVAMPFQLWNWVNAIGAPQAEMDEWRHRDIAAELSEMTGMQVTVRNDATAACGAELVFGTGERPKDFLYFYFGVFIGGGLVLNNQLFTGRTGNAAGVGPMPVPGPDGQMHRLFDVASISVLADAMEANGESSSHLFVMPDEWVVSEAVLSRWIDSAADGLASAILSATALLEIGAVVIDGWMPGSVRAEITRKTREAFQKLDLAGVYTPDIREGTCGPHARALGAAAIPLSQRYLMEPAAA